MAYINYTNDMHEVEMPYDATIQLTLTCSYRRAYLLDNWRYSLGMPEVMEDWSKRIRDLNDAEVALIGKVKVKY